MKIVLASNNAGKIRELTSLLSHLSIDLTPQTELHIEEVPETGLTFIENALIKARHASQMANLPAIADDSGIVVDALNGAPGIYSARYAGTKIPANLHNQKLLSALEDIPDDKRTAFFHCVLVYMAHANDPTPLVCSASWHGYILREPRGDCGFGYDPVFYVPSEKMSAAELPPERKNNMSHRGMALKLLLQALPSKL